MALASTSNQPDHVRNRTMKIDFSWGKMKARVTEEVDGQQLAVCVVDYHTFKSPSLEFKDPEETATWGSGNLHAVRIHADCELHGQHIKLQPLSRLKTSYMHMSHNFSNTNSPVQMTWESDGGFKDWDFICLGPDQVAVAKFSAHVWATKKVASIEFSGVKAMQSVAARQEILVTGLTLYSQMLLRVNNMFNLFGSAISRPDKEARELKEATGGEDSTTAKKTT